jgi:two-component sensor histidine kinase
VPRFRIWAARAARFQTIRYRLAGALALALLPVLILGAALSVNAFHRDAEHQRTDLTLSAERSAATARARIESAVAVLNTLKTEAMSPDCNARLKSLAQEVSGYDAFVRFDASGRVLCTSGAAALPASGAAWFQRLRGGDPRVLGRAPAGGYSNRPGLLAAVRLQRPGGAFDGALVAVLPLSALQPTVGDRALPEGAEVVVTDQAGAFLSATNRAAFDPRRTAWIRSVANHGSTLFYGRDARGRSRVYAGARLAGDDVFVLLSAPAQGAFSWARLNPVAAVVLPLLLWVLAVIAVLVVAERVVIRWLEYLGRVASIYAKGRFSVRPVQARNAPFEIRNLAITLDQMADAIEARDASLRDSLEHKDALMREIHHRVKNNLQVISSLLNMQQRSLTDPAARAAMGDTRQRIAALALIYRALYQSPDLRRVDVRQFLEELISQLVANDVNRGGAVVRTELEADTLVIDPDKLAPLALWAVEAISNAQKHALGVRGGVLRVRFIVERDECRLEVEDDGAGDDAVSAEAALAAGAGVGRTLMTAFARQLRGSAEIIEREGGGVLARLTFPSPEATDQAPEPASPEADDSATLSDARRNSATA